MKNAFLVSYPRSGQHYTQRLLEDVTGVDDYCVPNQCLVEGCLGKDLPRNKRSPCPAGRRFQKTHDPNLNLKITDDFLYVALFRRPMFSITSHLELTTRKGKGVPLRSAEKGLVFKPDTQEVWEEFALASAAQWRDFVLKWVGNRDKANVLPMRYEDITRNTDDVTKLFRFLFEQFDEQKLSEVMEKQEQKLEGGEHRIRSLSKFRYPLHDELLSKIRETVGTKALELAGYDDIL